MNTATAEQRRAAYDRRCLLCFGTGVTYTSEWRRWIKKYAAARQAYDRAFPHSPECCEPRSACIADQTQPGWAWGVTATCRVGLVAWRQSLEHAAVKAVEPHPAEAVCLVCRGTGVARPPRRQSIRSGR
ncbi:MAG: hypothetical protein JWO11_867 [Nocardioides sp.]|nr:hypothetical protein [Nocardioides sp.]